MKSLCPIILAFLAGFCLGVFCIRLSAQKSRVEPSALYENSTSHAHNDWPPNTWRAYNLATRTWVYLETLPEPPSLIYEQEWWDDVMKPLEQREGLEEVQRRITAKHQRMFALIPSNPAEVRSGTIFVDR